MTAKVFSNRQHQPDSEMLPLMWSTTVFFEAYMVWGSDNIVEEFGPKSPISLVAVKEEING